MCSSDLSLIAQEGDTITVPVTQKPRQGPLRPQTGAGQHRDKKKEQKQGKEKHKKPFAEQGVAEGLSDGGTAVIYDNGYVKIDGKMYKAKRMNHESGMGIAIQTPSKMYFSPIQNEYEMPSVTIHRALKLGGLNPVFNEGVAEGADNLNYIGNCTDDDAIEHIFGDATHFAQAVEEYGDEFTIDDLVVKYDPESDVHSFY